MLGTTSIIDETASARGPVEAVIECRIETMALDGIESTSEGSMHSSSGHPDSQARDFIRCGSMGWRGNNFRLKR
jgi:hypothetical protein